MSNKESVNSKKLFQIYLSSVLFLTLLACSSSPLQYDKAEQLEKNEEFANAVRIGGTPAVADLATPSNASNLGKDSRPQTAKKASGNKSAGKTHSAALPIATSGAVAESAKVANPKNVEGKDGSAKPAAVEAKVPAAKAKAQKNKKAAMEEVAVNPSVHEPDIESSVGFVGRRPIVDPYEIGEEVTHDVNYYKVSAGELKLKVEPLTQVNGVKAYTFATEIKTSSLFNSFYTVDDRAETWVGYDDLAPRAYQLHVKESGQLREAKSLFNQDTLEAFFWEKKVTKKNGEENKKQNWKLLPYSQNVFSAIFYMRAFTWEVGKDYAFRVANDEENLVFSAKALRKEVLDTKLGPLKSIVIQPKIYLKGAFKPVGDILIWLSDDEHKYVLRIECSIKIGTLVSEVVSIKPGTPW